MSLDLKILGRAKERLEENRRAYEARRDRRLREVYAKAPRVRQLDQEIRATVIDVVGLALQNGEDTEAAVERLRDLNLRLQDERAEALRQAGFTPAEIDEEYACPDCRDTGYVRLKPCSCLMALYNEERKSSLSSLFKLGSETFDNFDFSLYDDTPDRETGLSPRHNMEFIYEMCVQYARKFGPKSYNLFFNGPTGLGKTFLSACIARVVAENGFSVVYDMAGAIFTAFEDEQFQKSDDPATVRDNIKRYLTCDLLIMDDLGTEMKTSFTVSALYELINTRLVTGKKTIISSNLTFEELRGRYSPQIMSRLEGEYQVLRFVGRDIRLLKKNMP